MPVLGKQYPIPIGATEDDCPVRQPAFGNNGVVTGGAQPSAEIAQHLVAQKAQLSGVTRNWAVIKHHLARAFLR
jgi:hypothetical protein